MDKTREGKIKEIWDSIVPDLVEEHFPKHQCKERGQAIVLTALIYCKVLPKLFATFPQPLDEGKEGGMNRGQKIIEILEHTFRWGGLVTNGERPTISHYREEKKKAVDKAYTQLLSLFPQPLDEGAVLKMILKHNELDITLRHMEESIPQRYFEELASAICTTFGINKLQPLDEGKLEETIGDYSWGSSTMRFMHCDEFIKGLASAICTTFGKGRGVIDWEKLYDILDLVIYRHFGMQNKAMNDDNIKALAREISAKSDELIKESE
jgi:hypothetical protein